MYQGKHGEGIAERLVHDVPEMEDFLRARKEEQALGKSGFLGGRVNRLFELALLRGEESEKGFQHLSEAQCMAAKSRDADHAYQVEDHHVNECDSDWKPAHPVGIRHAKEGAQVRFGQKILRCQLLRKAFLQLL